MAGEKLTVGELVYKISGDMDNLKTELAKTQGEVAKLTKSTTDSGKAMDDTSKKAGGFGDSLKKLATGLGLVYVTKLLVDFGKASIQAFANAQQSAIQFNNAEENIAGTTKEQINLLNEYILALENKTSVDDKSIRQGAQILAQDQISIENQKKLLAGLVDIAVANSKATGSEVDIQGTATAVGRAFATGDLGGLTRQNIVGVDETTAKMFKLGDATQRTAILQKLLEENGKGAGEALGNSFQGDINRAKDAIEDLQVAVGEGLSVGLQVLKGELIQVVGGIGDTQQKTEKLGSAFVFIAGLIGFVVNTLKLLGQGLVAAAKIAFGIGKIIVASFIDVFNIIKQVGVAVASVGEAMGLLLTGKFKQAKEAIARGFDFSAVVGKTTQAIDDLIAANQETADGMLETAKALKENVETMANSQQVYKDTSSAINAVAEAHDSTRKATQASTQMTEEAKAALEKFQGQMIGFIDDAEKVKQKLEGDLADAFTKFSDDIKGNVKDTAEGLAKIVVDAEQKIKDLRAKLQTETDPAQRTDLQKQIDDQQKILDARVGFETRQATTIAGIRKKLEDAGITISQAGLDALTTTASLETQIEKQRKDAALNEFQLFEQQQNEKLVILADNLIKEATLIKGKIDTQAKYEADLTAFLTSEDGKRLKGTEAWAKATIAKYGEVAASLQNVISLQSRVQGAGGVTTAPIVPGSTTSTPATGTGASNTTNNSKTINAPISLQATITDGTDPSTIAKDLAWHLSHL